MAKSPKKPDAKPHPTAEKVRDALAAMEAEPDTGPDLTRAAACVRQAVAYMAEWERRAPVRQERRERESRPPVPKPAPQNVLIHEATQVPVPVR